MSSQPPPVFDASPRQGQTANPSPREPVGLARDHSTTVVMPALVAGIHVLFFQRKNAWMHGRSPRVTALRGRRARLRRFSQATLSAATFETASGRLRPLKLSSPIAAMSAALETAIAIRDVTSIWPSFAASQSRAAVLITVPTAL